MSNLKYLLYNNDTKEITYNICPPQGSICDIQTIDIIDPTSVCTIGNSPELTNIINNTDIYSSGWIATIRGTGATVLLQSPEFGNQVSSTSSRVYGTCATSFSSTRTSAFGIELYTGNTGPTGSSTLSFGASTSRSVGSVPVVFASWLFQYGLTGYGNWLTGLGATGQGTSTDYSFTSGGVSAKDNSIYFTSSSSSGTVYAFYGTTGGFVGITGAYSTTGGQCAYLAKYDASSNPQFLARIDVSDSATDKTFGKDVAAFSDGVYWVGRINTLVSGPNSIRAWNGPNGSSVGITGGPGVTAGVGFLVQYDLSGQAKWMGGLALPSSLTTSGQNNNISLNGVDVDEDNNVYVCGTYPFIDASTILGLYDGPSGSNLGITGTSDFAGGAQIGLIAKWNSSGKSKWLSKIGSIGSSTPLTNPTGISYADGNVYVSGSYQDSPLAVYNGPKGASVGLTGNSGPSGVNDTFILNLTKNGIAQWLGRISSNAYEDSGPTSISPINVSATSEGCYINTYLGATGIINVYNGPNGSVLGISCEVLEKYQNAAVVKYNTTGQAQWMVRLTTSSSGSVAQTINKSTGITVGKSGIYFLTLVGQIQSTNYLYYTRNNASTLKFNLTYASSPAANISLMLMRMDFEGNLIPICYLDDNNSLACPNPKYITYKTSANNPINIVNSNTMKDPSFGTVTGFTSSSSGANINLLYNKTATTDWFITKNNGFQLY